MSFCPGCQAQLAAPDATCAACAPRPAARRALPMPTAAPAPVPAQPPASVAPAWAGSQPSAFFAPPVAPPPAAPGWQAAPPQPAPAYGVPHQPAPPPYAVPPAPQVAWPPLGPTAAPAWPGGPSLPAVWTYDPSARGWGGLQQGWWAAIGGGVLLVLLVAALTGSSDHTVTGALEVVDDSAYELADGTICDTYGGYSDVGESAMVTLTDAGGDVIGRASLAEGYVDGDRCVFSFTISGVPDSSSYGVLVGDRNTVVFTREDMEDTDWSPVVVLGD